MALPLEARLAMRVVVWEAKPAGHLDRNRPSNNIAYKVDVTGRSHPLGW